MSAASSRIRKHVIRGGHEPVYKRTSMLSPRLGHLKIAAALVDSIEEKLFAKRASASFSKAYNIAKKAGLLEAYRQVAMEKVLGQLRSMKSVKADRYREILKAAVDKAFETGRLKDGLKIIEDLGNDRRLGVQEKEMLEHALVTVLGSTIAFDSNDVFTTRRLKGKLDAIKNLPDMVSKQLRRQLGIVNKGGSLLDDLKKTMGAGQTGRDAVIILDDKIITDSRIVTTIKDGEPHPLHQLRQLKKMSGRGGKQPLENNLTDSNMPDPVVLSFDEVIKGKYRVELLDALLGDNWYTHYKEIDGDEKLRIARNEVVEHILRNMAKNDRRVLSQYYLYKVAQLAIDSVSRARNVYEAEILYEKAFKAEMEKDPLFRKAVVAKVEELDEKEFAIAHLLHLSSKIPIGFTESFSETVYAVATTAIGSLPFGKVVATAAAGARGASSALSRTIMLSDEFSFWTTSPVDYGYVPPSYLYEHEIARGDLRRLVAGNKF